MIRVAFVKDGGGKNYLIQIEVTSATLSTQETDHYGKVKHSIDGMHQVEDVALAKKILKFNLSMFPNGSGVFFQILMDYFSESLNEMK